MTIQQDQMRYHQIIDPDGGLTTQGMFNRLVKSAARIAINGVVVIVAGKTGYDEQAFRQKTNYRGAWPQDVDE